MKNRQLLIVLILLFSITFCKPSLAQQTKKDIEEMKFTKEKWGKISLLAQNRNRFIFVDAYATWCKPCRLLKEETFKDKAVVSFFNKNFINVTMDMEIGEGLTLAQTWNVTSYPTLLFFNPKGKLVLMHLGFVDGKKLIEIGKQSLSKK